MKDWKVKNVQYMLGEEWTIVSAGGSTGEAYYAKSAQKRLFLKRNSSPFLAVLSAQGIVPKLVWTKRLENGDVITAQEWLDGKELNPEEMQHPMVANLLGKIHHSAELLDLLTRMGKKPMDPSFLFQNLKRLALESNDVVVPVAIHQGLKFMENHLPKLTGVKQVVCHCDLNHNNWLVSNCGQLYLIDWDNAQIGDAALDLGMLLNWYIPEQDWDNWLEMYGIQNHDNLYTRMHWYMIYDLISTYYTNQLSGKFVEATKDLKELYPLVERAKLYSKS